MACLPFLLHSLRSFAAIPVPERGGHRIGYRLSTIRAAPPRGAVPPVAAGRIGTR
jgi:hypothetical protein